MNSTKIEESPVRMEIKEGQLSQVKNWQVGKTYKVVATVEMIGGSKGWDGKGPFRGEFLVKKVESAGEVKGAKPTSDTKTDRKSRVSRVAERVMDEDGDYDD